MTKEDKDLLFKDLCARLPYDVKCQDVTLDFVGTMTDVSRHDNMCKLYNDYGDNYTCFMANCKPYLIPLSSISEELKNFIRWKLTTPKYDWKLTTPKYGSFEDSLEDLLNNNMQVVHYCYEHHLDINGLIERGLALEAPEGMYN